VKLENLYFVANFSKTLRINFYQNRSSIVKVMTQIWCVFLWLCAWHEKQRSTSFL